MRLSLLTVLSVLICLSRGTFINTYIYLDAACTNIIGQASTMTACTVGTGNVCAGQGGGSVNSTCTSQLPSRSTPTVFLYTDSACTTYATKAEYAALGGCYFDLYNTGSWRLDCTAGTVTLQVYSDAFCNTQTYQISESTPGSQGPASASTIMVAYIVFFAIVIFCLIL